MSSSVSHPGGDGDHGKEADGGHPEINVVGLSSIVVFYLAVLAVGVWAGWKRRRTAKRLGHDFADQEEMMLAGRDLGIVVGVLTTGGNIPDT